MWSPLSPGASAPGFFLTQFKNGENEMKNTTKLANQLLAVVGRIIDVGQDLNAITSSMLDAVDNAVVDVRGLDSASHILAWAGWAGEQSSDILGIVNDLMCTIEDLIGSKRKEVRGHG
jgi:hypothetical protein